MRHCLSVAIGYLCLGIAAAQVPVGPPLPIILHHADSFSWRQSDSGAVRELTGNVWLQQGNAVLRCGSAVQYLETGSLLLRHNVRIEHGDLRIAAPLVSYEPQSGIAIADRGADIEHKHRTIRARWAAYNIPQQELQFATSVQYADDTLRLWTDSLRYLRRTDRAYAWGGVYVESPPYRLVGEADRLLYAPDAGVLVLVGHALLRQHDETQPTSIWLSADSIVLADIHGAHSLQATGSVVLLRDTLWAASAERLLWEHSSSQLWLSESPHLWYGPAELTGDSAYAVLHSGQLRTLIFFGQARLRMGTPFPERSHQLRGDSLVVQHPSDSLIELIAYGNARSLYCHRAASGMPEGLFRHSADRIELLFIGDSLHQARWLGGVYGEYIPENLVRERFSAWSLPGMAWQRQRPSLPPWRHRTRWLP